MSSDEFEDYDFSEFTEEELAWVDSNISQMLSAESVPSTHSTDLARDGVSPLGSPAIHIAIESETDAFRGTANVSYVLNPSVFPRARGRATSSLRLTPAIRTQSPFQKFCSWKKYFSVTDLVSPSWCEVQHEYGLYGKKYKPLPQRPASFTSKNGKEIQVHKDVAQKNDRRLNRGKSVHKALEDEVHPQKTFVHAVTEEERFGLRLIQLISGFNEILVDGRTRELPVFTITHGEVVLGVIDEVLRFPLTLEERQQSERSPTPPLGPQTEKKQRRSISRAGAAAVDDCSADEVLVASTATAGSILSYQEYGLHLVDYKTRRAPSLPPDEDTTSSRLQLMLYHRMLSSVLAPETFNFEVLWARMNLDPAKPFSERFIQDIRWRERTDTGHGNSHVDLQCLLAVWVSTVHSERMEEGLLMGVNPELQLVYRCPSDRVKQNRRKRAVDCSELDDPLDILELQDELNLSQAIEESLRQLGQDETEVSTVTRAVAQSIKQGHSDSGEPIKWRELVRPAGLGQDDTGLAWAIERSLLSCAQNVRDQVSENLSREVHDQSSEAPPSATDAHSEDQTISAVSPIIGVKKFMMDDYQLDSYLDDVLQWWHGARPARGVDIAQSNRCFTCEYRESCEWRERKAQEAATALERRPGSRMKEC
ncbi:exonuclease V a 5' deoxyribonuclease-domain-containing protein [Phlebopus sp. FC_14]|nr:exonuclease V a 5' deoxyribonuclease-domain-containing protein [Phlebopus sp. FC_14]